MTLGSACRRPPAEALPAGILCLLAASLAFALSPPVLVILLRNGRGVDVAAVAVVAVGERFQPGYSGGLGPA
jgi:hypothetical protein